MAGRKPIPIEIKKLKGTYRKHRDPHSPAPSKSALVAPKWLNTDAKRVFNTLKSRIGELGMESKTFTEALALLSARMEEVQRYSAILEKEGCTYATTNREGEALQKPHPVINLREKAMAHAHKLLVEFGLTAASIQRIGPLKQPKRKNAFDDF